MAKKTKKSKKEKLHDCVICGNKADSPIKYICESCESKALHPGPLARFINWLKGWRYK